jgi:hypothetical protein
MHHLRIGEILSLLDFLFSFVHLVRHLTLQRFISTVFGRSEGNVSRRGSSDASRAACPSRTNCASCADTSFPPLLADVDRRTSVRGI